jgi:Mn2+/Fe2+ NRAMP family transporter
MPRSKPRRHRAASRRRDATESRVLAVAQESIPALITGGAGDDPAGVVTYTIVGATTGFSQLWVLALSTPMLAAATVMAGRIAVAARSGLGTVIERRYGRAVSLLVVLLLIVPNVATIAADTAGVASVIGLATGVPWEGFVPVILLALGLVLRRGYAQMKRALTLLTTVLLCYVIAAVLAHPRWRDVLEQTLVPRVALEKSWLVAALGLLGTTISPYMLFWQANEEVEELNHGATIHAADFGTTVWIGMLYSNAIAFFIIVAAAATIHGHGEAIGTVADAARALEPLRWVGRAAFVIGVIAAGLLALPVLAASTAYAVAEVFGWREGIGLRAAQARGFTVVLLAALVGGGLIAMLPGFHPAAALYYSQVLDGVLLPVILAVLLMLSNDRRVVAERRNPAWVNWMGGIAVIAALAADFAALLT